MFDWLIQWMPALITVAGSVTAGIFLIINRRGGEKARREPSWHELVEENRNLRTDLTGLSDRFDEHKRKTDLEITTLKATQALADRREVLLYFHTKALRDHILSELPPPPPQAPAELMDWFEQFEDTLPGS